MGIITDIQRFSVHDGPGVRTTVFFKGCPLRCFWCHNPETNQLAPQVRYLKNMCVHCGSCAEVCPLHTMTPDHHFRASECTGCLACTKACRYGALTAWGQEQSPEEVMKVVLADRAFYGQTGGLTLTGGEPAMQPEFCLALLRMAKQEGIHTCIETSGCFPPAFLAQIKGLCDLVLLDFKDANGVRLQQNTGQSLDQLLENLYRLDQSGIGYCVRSIILKGINDTPQDVIALKKIKNTLHNCSEWTLFPYHGLGNAKREQLGQQYLAQDYTPNESHLALLQKLLQD